MKLLRVFSETNRIHPQSPSLDFYCKTNVTFSGYWGYFTTTSNSSPVRSLDHMRNNHNVFANYVNKNSELVPIKGK